jgi:hypothetical protein
VKIRGFCEVGDEVRGDFRADHDSVRLANTTETLRRYAQRARLGMTAQNRCAELRLRAERKLGQCLAGTPGNSSGGPKLVPLRNGYPTLGDLGINPETLAPGTAIGGYPGQGFRLVFGDGDEQEWEITTRLLQHYSKRRQATAKDRHRIVGGA